MVDERLPVEEGNLGLKERSVAVHEDMVGDHMKLEEQQEMFSSLQQRLILMRHLR